MIILNPVGVGWTVAIKISSVPPFIHAQHVKYCTLCCVGGEHLMTITVDITIVKLFVTRTTKLLLVIFLTLSVSGLSQWFHLFLVCWCSDGVVSNFDLLDWNV